MSQEIYLISKAIGPTPLKRMRVALVNRSAKRTMQSANSMSDGRRLAIPGGNGSYIAGYHKPSDITFGSVENTRMNAVARIKAGERGQVRGARRDMRAALRGQANTQNNIKQINDDAFAAARPKPKSTHDDLFDD